MSPPALNELLAGAAAEIITDYEFNDLDAAARMWALIRRQGELAEKTVGAIVCRKLGTRRANEIFSRADTPEIKAEVASILEAGPC